MDITLKLTTQEYNKLAYLADSDNMTVHDVAKDILMYHVTHRYDDRVRQDLTEYFATLNEEAQINLITQVKRALK